MCAGINCNNLGICSVLVLLFSYSLCVDDYEDYEFVPDGEDIRTRSPSLATLAFVGIISRHGSRVPIRTYANDPYPYTDRRFWPQGKGELTNYGKQQMYGLGERLRKRYNGYLPIAYYPNDTIAMYNPYNRDFESLSCLLASLYLPVGRQVWNENLLWQPIPSSVYDFDVCDLLENGKCPQYTLLALKTAATYGVKEAANSLCLLKYVSNHTGQTFLSVVQLGNVFDPLAMQEENGFKLPEWTKAVYPELKEYAVQTWNAVYAGSNEILTFTAGPDLEQMADLFNKRINGTLPENTKLFIEMAHDCTLYALLKAMGSSIGDEMIKTSAYLTFELHHLDTSHIVQIFYNKDYMDENPALVNIERCPSPCSLENFNKFVKNVTGTKTWKSACNRVSLF